ncbi:hypothetical protein RDI58_011245 [Solanum bulbocastanum]|uniref:Transposase MuDR plant domain-containing protein n=1 Tax=Solanum bulbocastanum TaxID=147425 RepID=A0AAN8TQY6_SOLBU
MAVTEFVVAGGDYMGEWEETPKNWNWKYFNKTTVPIALRRNGLYDDMITSIIVADIGIDGFWPTLRINVNMRLPIEPTNLFNGDNDSIGNERLGDHSKESMDDNSNESLGDHSMNIHDDPTNVESQPVYAEDSKPECWEKMQVQKELGSQSNHSFSDGTNLCINQTFSNKNELKLLLVEAAAKKSFDFATVKSFTKYLKVKCVSRNCAWMLRARKYECSNRFRLYKYIGKHSCGVEHANSSNRKISIKVIASLYGGVVAKEMVRGTAENGYSCLSAFSYMFGTLNVGSSYCLMNDASCTFFFEKLKEIVVDEPNLCFISNRHKSIANSIVNVYNHAHHGYCIRHLGENLRVNHHCGDYLYLYYNAAKAYSLEEFDNHFVEFKNKYPTATVVLENDIGFEKWSRAHFRGNRYDVMTTNIAESLYAMLIDERE